MAILSDQEILRYNRQISLKGFDFDGQEALKQASVLIIGLGGLGSAASQYLACAGVGAMTLVDFDSVELSNLQRQVLHTSADIGRKKVHSAAESLQALNPDLVVTTIDQQLNDDLLSDLVKTHSLVVDATDNMTTRNQLNRLCYMHKIPLVSGAAIRMEGQLSVFTYKKSEPCYQCLSSLFADTRLSCSETGVMAPVVGVIGAAQALEAIKILTNYGSPLTGKLLILDAMTMSWKEIKLPKNTACSLCSSPD
ncbi:molybdopterin-synthase adenylyltransferase MoeB [Vibrio sp. HA2012]|uniref:molybdopterin-synthase adenylyltransferase MoeB n=1 Tax=Vibrio sp. HA2012 TaxID=1971595 RepID=UPI000C2C609F|nr:molybdopterin-synthase adenylyltransferase MoeB [Vibrio sp. HA2012]PJC87495.1 molybdopterin-synthase adenylyltransferase MoeB [Vibrio sp. HA2012]